MSPVSPDSSGAPRVLVDATAVPADRGGVGRYVDGLVSALGEAGADLVVVCQRSDAERFTPAGARGRDRARPVRHLAPAGPAGLGADRPAAGRAADRRRRHPLAALHDAAARAGAGGGDLHDVTVLHRARAAQRRCAAGFYRSATRTVAAPRERGSSCRREATRDELVRLLDADPARIDVARHGVDHRRLPPADRGRDAAGSSDRLGLHGRPYVAFLGVARAPQERARPGPRLGRRRSTDLRRAAGARARRQQRLGRRGRPGGRRGAAAPEGVRPGFLRPADLPGLLGGADGRGVPEQGRGLRLAGARGDGLRGRRAHRPPAVAARGRRRRGRLHRAGRRQHRARRCARCSTTRRGGRSCRSAAPSGPASSPGRRPRQAHLASYARPPGGRPRADARAPDRGDANDRGRPAGRRQGHPAAPADGAHAQADAADRGRAVPRTTCWRAPREAGVDHVVLATSYRAEIVLASTSATGRRSGCEIDYVTEDEPLGTGGGIRNVADLLQQRTGRPGRGPQRRRPVRARHRRAARGPAPRTAARTSRCTSPRSRTRGRSAACRATPTAG